MRLEEERLDGNALLDIHREVGITADEVIDKFAAKRGRF